MSARKTQPVSILMREPAFGRVAARLDAARIAVDPVFMDEHGALTRARRPSAAGDAAFTVAWAGSDVFVEGLFPALASAALSAATLRWFQSGAAGTDNPLFARLIDRSVRLTTCHAPSESVADYVMHGVLDHFQRGPERRASRERREWIGMPFREIGGSRWVILGFGAIGQAIARRARAFGAHITGIRRTRGTHELADAMKMPDGALSCVADADVVVLCMPLNPETRACADAALFSAMRSDTVLVNVSRGAIIDEAALLASLDRGKPGHAILDVCSVEPLPHAHPFWTHPRITLTSHVAGMGSGLVERSDELFLENLGRFVSGAPLLHEVGACSPR